MWYLGRSGICYFYLSYKSANDKIHGRHLLPSDRSIALRMTGNNLVLSVFSVSLHQDNKGCNQNAQLYRINCEIVGHAWYPEGFMVHCLKYLNF